MDEKLMGQVIGEMVKSTELAMGMLTAALVRQMDPYRLRTDLTAVLATGHAEHGPTLAMNLCRSALAAVDAEILLRQMESSPQH